MGILDVFYGGSDWEKPMSEFNASELAKRWVNHATNLDLISADHTGFIEGSLTGWFTSVFKMGRDSAADEIQELINRLKAALESK